MNYLLHSMLLIVLTAFNIANCAPMSGVHTRSIDSNEGPTSETLPASRVQAEPAVRHAFFVDIYRCLKLRDEGKDLSAAGCVPRVFPTVEDVPVSSLSDTVLGFIANSSVHKNNMTLTLKVSEQTVLDNINSVHLRIHKNKVDNDFVRRFKDECDLTDGLRLSLHILSPNKVSIQEMTLSYNDLLKEEWTDFTSFKDIYNSTLHSADETVLQLEINIKNCTSLTLQDIGISTGKGEEPVLVVYGKQHDIQRAIKGKFEKVPTDDSILQQRARRNIESSGTPPIMDSEKCRMISYNVSNSYVHPETYIPGKFEFNYCSGQCIHPIPRKSGPLHAKILAYLQVLFADQGSPTSEQIIVPPPCCIPTKYAPVSFIVQETEWSYKIETLPDITVRECGCH